MSRGVDAINLMGDSKAKTKETSKIVLPRKLENDDVDLFVTTEMQDSHFRLIWIVKKLGSIPNGKIIEGPDFQTYTSEEWNISLEIGDCLFFYLRNTTNKTLDGVCELTLTDLSGKVWLTEQEIYSSIDSKAEIDLLLDNDDMVNHFKKTPDDSLIIYCCLKTNTSFLTTLSNQPSKINEKQNYIENFQNLLKTGHQADMTFKFGEEVIPAHKLILCTQSPYFENMFQNGMTEQVNNMVTITDVNIFVFRKILQFVYTGRVTDMQDFVRMTPEDVYDVYKASDKYQVMELRQICGNILYSKVTEDNAMIILLWIERHDDLNLKSRIFTYITSHYKSISKSDKWKLFVVQNPVLSSELLSYIIDRII